MRKPPDHNQTDADAPAAPDQPPAAAAERQSRKRRRQPLERWRDAIGQPKWPEGHDAVYFHCPITHAASRSLTALGLLLRAADLGGLKWPPCAGPRAS
jgi:hypothetical protein